jgi:hypothetical protein
MLMLATSVETIWLTNPTVTWSFKIHMSLLLSGRALRMLFAIGDCGLDQLLHGEPDICTRCCHCVVCRTMHYCAVCTVHCTTLVWALILSALRKGAKTLWASQSRGCEPTAVYKSFGINLLIPVNGQYIIKIIYFKQKLIHIWYINFFSFLLSGLPSWSWQILAILLDQLPVFKGSLTRGLQVFFHESWIIAGVLDIGDGKEMGGYLLSW